MTSIIELDREQSELKRDSLYQRGIYELIIEASDQGSPSLTSEIAAKVYSSICFVSPVITSLILT